MSRQPAVSVNLVLRAEGRVLILQHRNGKYHFPGGKLEWSESPEAALRRELVEELKYAIPGEPTFIRLYNYVAPDKSEHMVILHYVLAIDHQPHLETTKDGPNAEPDSEIHWLTRDELSAIIPEPKFIEQIFT